MLILAGCIINSEMGTVLSTLGARLDPLERMNGLMQVADSLPVKIWQKTNTPLFDKHHAQDQNRL
jgi:dihydrolipoamide dehydrogenase